MSNLEEIKQKVDLVDFISEYVILKKAGANFKGLCPFHNEKSPSCMVSREKQIWHCFGCGKGGDIFKFLMEKEGMDFGEAVRALAKRAGIKLSYEDRKISGERTKLLGIVDAATKFFHEQLLASPQAEDARAYLRMRGLTAETVVKFKLGFAPSEWDALIAYFTIKYKTKIEDLAAAGLVIKRENGRGEASVGREFYDRFRNRIMFPIHDTWGHVVGFTGRLMPEDEKKTDAGGKYVNTPATALYNKSNILFGLYFAKEQIKKEGRVVIVEGNMDVISSHQAGVTNVVASSGTALTGEQVRLLKRFTDTVILAFDADFAGETAATRGINEALAAGMQVKVIMMPEVSGHVIAKDPDELIGKAPLAWKQVMSEAKPIISYLVAKESRGRDLSKLEDRRVIAEAVLPILAQLADPVERALWIREVAKTIDVPETAIKESLARKLNKTHGKTENPQELPVHRDKKIMLGERIFALLIDNPSLWTEAREKLQDSWFSQDEFHKLYNLFTVYYNSKTGENLERDNFTDFARKDGSASAQIDILQMLVDKDFGQFDASAKSRDLDSAIKELRDRASTEQKKALTEELRAAEKENNREKITQILNQLQTFNK